VKLNQVYSSAYKFDKNIIKADQLSWLKNIRNKCDTESCMKKVYVDRILYLFDKIESLKSINETNIEKSQYSQICGDIAGLAESNKLKELVTIGVGVNDGFKVNDMVSKWNETKEEKILVYQKLFSNNLDEIFNIRISNNGDSKKYLRYWSGGTCSSYDIYASDYILASVDNYEGRVEVNDPDDELRWANWGGSEYIIYYKERHFVVTGSLSSPNLVSWVKPDGKILPLCLFEEAASRLTVESSKNKELCSTIANNTIQPEKWINVTDQIRNDGSDSIANFKDRYGDHADGIEMLPIEIKMGAESWGLAKMFYDSGAGCGSHNEWLRKAVLNSDPLKLYPNDQFFDGVSAENIDIYKNNGEYFIGSFYESSPSFLYRLSKDELVQECEFRRSISFKVKPLF